MNFNLKENQIRKQQTETLAAFLLLTLVLQKRVSCDGRNMASGALDMCKIHVTLSSREILARSLKLDKKRKHLSSHPFQAPVKHGCQNDRSLKIAFPPNQSTRNRCH